MPWVACRNMQSRTEQRRTDGPLWSLSTRMSQMSRPYAYHRVYWKWAGNQKNPKPSESMERQTKTRTHCPWTACRSLFIIWRPNCARRRRLCYQPGLSGWSLFLKKSSSGQTGVLRPKSVKICKFELNNPVDTVFHIRYMNFNRQQLNENCHCTPDYTRYCDWYLYRTQFDIFAKSALKKEVLINYQ